MQKYHNIIIAGVLTGAALLTPVSSFAASMTPKPTPKMEKETMVATEATGTKDEAMMAAKVEYTLPYPGILPDHPLYFLKRFRDWLMEQLIADPVKKIQFYVQQSDKAINASVFLSLQQKQTLTTQEATSANMSMEKAVKAAASLKDQGKELPGDVVSLMTQSLMKHQEVLGDLVQKAGDTQKANLTSALDTVKKLETDVAKLK